ncbi:TetR/AcrR family transcriptional regulator [Nocardioides acrostichi]|uniref:TetR/AcrR family transcriptional regulator n=1 Tax=Nocardioides acrostichi TaxID=2784339 RepID=A0A930YBC6_9ACTN|nr:TetR/AcrR family transcriptional regulator [Nocardioides acrostichi]MBF4160344.1 TetR/AcrR family transcriptional regulator [Nocardioides acrostichi]
MTLTDDAPSRPRVEGDRETEILDACLEVLVEVGYDRLTMDAVAMRARASKATLYRRWEGKEELVVSALAHSKGPFEVPDTGSLRGDLIASHCGHQAPEQRERLAALLTTVATNPTFAARFHAEVIAPRVARTREIWERARLRGEVADDLDIDLLAPALPGIVLHRAFVLGDPPDEACVARIVDHVILPAATRGA